MGNEEEEEKEMEREGHHTNGCCWSVGEGLFLVGGKERKKLEIRLQSCEMPQHKKSKNKIHAVQQFQFPPSRNKNKKEHLCVLHTIF